MTKYLLITILFFISLLSNLVFAKNHELNEFQETNYQYQPDSTRPSEALSDRDISLQIDQYFSPVVGSDALISVLRGYQALDDAFIPSTAGNRNISMILGRIAKFLFIEGTLFGAEMVTQHEVFGHGFRLREFHIPVQRYRITPWSGSTSFGAAKFNALSLHEKAAVDTGGVEANGILAKEIRNRWLQSETIDSREAHLYFISNLDQTSYVLNMRHRDNTFANTGHDVVAYINNINQWYQRPVLDSHKLKRKILIDFLDPYLFYSLYSVGLYMVEGDQSFRYPMISIGEYQYLPAMRTVLAPYGPEYQLNNFIKSPEHNIQAGLRYGNTGGRHSTGLTLETSQLFTSDLLFIDGRADLWSQPKLFAATSATAKAHVGGALSLIARYRIASRIEIKGQAGYKTTGYVPGEALKHSPILRIGFAAFL